MDSSRWIRDRAGHPTRRIAPERLLETRAVFRFVGQYRGEYWAAATRRTRHHATIRRVRRLPPRSRSASSPDNPLPATRTSSGRQKPESVDRCVASWSCNEAPDRCCAIRKSGFKRRGVCLDPPPGGPALRNDEQRSDPHWAPPVLNRDAVRESNLAVVGREHCLDMRHHGLHFDDEARRRLGVPGEDVDRTTLGADGECDLGRRFPARAPKVPDHELHQQRVVGIEQGDRPPLRSSRPARPALPRARGRSAPAEQWSGDPRRLVRRGATSACEQPARSARSACRQDRRIRRARMTRPTRTPSMAWRMARWTYRALIHQRIGER